MRVNKSSRLARSAQERVSDHFRALRYISPSIFEILKDHISRNLRRKGEFDLTAALDVLRAQEGFLGYLIHGNRFDIGAPLAYLETLKTFPSR